MDLSILIPARNEMFLNQTIKNLLDCIEGNTEIIVVLDGQWSVEPIPQEKRLTVVFLPKSVGQRAATNLACKLSKAKYVMKLDAHCAVDKGFDVKLMKDMQDDWTVVPKMYNLHAFDWVCECGHREYQGKSHPCSKCGKEMKRMIVWKPKKSPETTAMRFDSDLRFQYWSWYKKHQKGTLVETMSILGACWMMTRKKYWELNACDESFGSWGQQGTEVACKTWLSGGKLICNKNTWFAHMFRTQGGDFGFPYEQSGKQIEHARKLSKELFVGGKWKGKYDLKWLLEKFNPPWASKGIIYYTDNQAPVKLAKKCQKNLLSIGLPISSASLKPMPHFGDNIHLPLQRSVLTMFTQILTALERSKAEIVYFCEADVLYHPSHFEFTPTKKDVFYYNENVWKRDWDTGKSIHYDCKQVSGICCYRELAIKHYRKRLELVQKNGFSLKMGYEPGTHNRPERVDDYKSESWKSKYPNIDFRHGSNLSPTRWKKEEFRNQKNTKGWVESDTIPGWELNG